MDIDDMIENSFWRDILYEIINTMDPWDIDLSELATKYSQKVNQMQEMNFKIPANVILVSSVLLRMKADILAAVDVNPFEFCPELEDGLMFNEFDLSGFEDAGELSEEPVEYEDGDTIPLAVKPKRVNKRRVTATELIAAIQEVLEDRQIKTRLKNESIIRKPIEIIMSTDIKQLIEDTYKKVLGILSKKKDEVVLFSEMVPQKKDKVSTFMSLLQLSNDQRISLKQERIYDEIFISVR